MFKAPKMAHVHSEPFQTFLDIDPMEVTKRQEAYVMAGISYEISIYILTSYLSGQLIQIITVVHSEFLAVMRYIIQI